jgi:DNA (cytosine-5)-methyltransferase 1
MRHGSLFSGIGGFDLAAEWMGWENVFHCEWNEFGQKILKHYWPNAKSYEDITKTDFSIYRGTVDIISGGFPCQPFSQAGKRKGTKDERYLWPEMLRVIREVCPKWVIGENVYGLVSWDGGMVFDTVKTDLENEGYKVIPVVLPAASVNAPHNRARIFFIATNTNYNGCHKYDCSNEKYTVKGRINALNDIDKMFGSGSSSYTNDSRSGASKCSDFKNRKKNSKEWGDPQLEFSGLGNTKNVANANSKVMEGWHKQGKANKPTDEEVGVKSFDSPRNWESFPTISPICIGDDGLSNKLDGITFSKWRNQSIIAAGNAVVPQLVLQIFKTIEEYERVTSTKKD